MNQSDSTENTTARLKSIVEDIVKGYLSFISSSDLQQSILKMVRESYQEAIEDAGIEFNMNFTGDYRAVGALQNFGFNTVKDLTEEIKGDLRQSMSMGLMNRENIPELRERIQKVMQVAKERAKLIAQTETVRAYNQGYYDAAKEGRLKVTREWSAQPEKNQDNPCPICESMHGQRRGMNENFTAQDGTTHFLPPAHPRCKCRVIYVQS